TRQIQEQEGRGDRLEQFRPRYLCRALGSWSGRYHGSALDDPCCEVGLADGARIGLALLRTGGPVWHDDGQSRPDLCFTALQDSARVPDPGLQRDQGTRCRFLQTTREGRLPARLW